MLPNLSYATILYLIISPRHDDYIFTVDFYEVFVWTLVSVTNVMRCERRVTVYIPFDLLYFELPLKHFLSFKILIDFPSNPDFSQPHDLDKALLEDLVVKVPIAHYFSCIFQLLIISK